MSVASDAGAREHAGPPRREPVSMTALLVARANHLRSIPRRDRLIRLPYRVARRP
jgi:hypothetical protein